MACSGTAPFGFLPGCGDHMTTIHISLINGRPSADDPSPELLEFTSARYIRLRFQRIRTLNADLMMFAHKDPREIDPIVTRRYYYSVKDISVGGMCICYGHARACPLDPATNKSRCECEHNTCGESCDRCCPGFHQKPWRAGTFLTKTECEACNCHGKAEECYYDENVARRNLSLNIHGKYIGGGVCINCTQNTAGINCETCIDGFFRPKGVSPNYPRPCQPCHCDPVGSLSEVCVKDEKYARRGLKPGSCHCKTGFGGLNCDHCVRGYSGYPDCQPCNCSGLGSANEDPCVGPCSCKENVEGEDCSRCKSGFFNLHKDNPKGCDECFCSGVSNRCQSSYWTYGNIQDMHGWYLTDISGRIQVVPQLDNPDSPQQISISNSEARRSLLNGYYWSAPPPYLGNKLPAVGGQLTFTISYDLEEEEEDTEKILQLMTILQGNMLRISTVYNEVNLDPTEEHIYQLPLKEELFTIHGTNLPVSRKDFMTVLANLERVLIQITYNLGMDAIFRLSSVNLESAVPYPTDRSIASAVEVCQCPPGYSGSSCENCKDHTSGPYCNECLPGFYGDPTRGTSEDCQPCSCPLNIPSNKCAEGYFGQPSIPGGSCQPCRCNDNLDFSIPGSCDSLSGSCLICKPGTTGRYCELCADGYFGDAVDAKNCQPCHCNTNGSFSELCDTRTGQCECRPNVQGRRCDECKVNVEGVHCDRCQPGKFGLDAKNPLGCSSCYCFGVTSQCSEAEGLIRKWVMLSDEQTILPLVDEGLQHTTTKGIAFQHPEIVAKMDEVRQDLHLEPFYWKLPEQFEGKKLMAYGGKLKYAIYFEARDETGFSTYKPQVIIRGGTPTHARIITRHMAAPLIGQLTRHEIEMTEKEWKYYGDDPRISRTVTREDFLDILYDIHYILIKATYGNVNCQHHTAGDFCERCALGYYGIVRGLPNDCQPCACPLISPSNNFSPSCVLEGLDDYRCTACPRGYEGQYCERCAPGYTGSPSSPGGSCQECECDPYGSLPVPCDAVTGLCTCRPGATGRKCDGCEHWHAREGTECVCTYTNLAAGSVGLAFMSVSVPTRLILPCLQ
ncbi:Laminin subunit alpha-2 [Cricetulus griseus]|uniref:Laminin subunit alpha-2 n=1 Tax=Cricetulus griseus TaxID=10029 RepID=G3IE68_CRIGR|nr:Laminin subunit alpha-2 [Cricetulus griseus]